MALTAAQQAEVDWWKLGCFVSQPRYVPGHPEITVATAMANPPVANPDWVIDDND